MNVRNWSSLTVAMQISTKDLWEKFFILFFPSTENSMKGVTFSYRFKEGIWGKVVKTEWFEMNVRNWSSLTVAMQIRTKNLWEKFFILFFPSTENSMKGVTFSYRFKEGIWGKVVKTEWFEMNVRNWSSLTVAMQRKYWRKTCRKYFLNYFWLLRKILSFLAST